MCLNLILNWTRGWPIWNLTYLLSQCLDIDTEIEQESSPKVTWFDARWGIEASNWRAQSQQKLMRRLLEWMAINVMRCGQEEVIQEKKCYQCGWKTVSQERAGEVVQPTSAVVPCLLGDEGSRKKRHPVHIRRQELRVWWEERTKSSVQPSCPLTSTWVIKWDKYC